MFEINIHNGKDTQTLTVVFTIVESSFSPEMCKENERKEIICLPNQTMTLVALSQATSTDLRRVIRDECNLMPYTLLCIAINHLDALFSTVADTFNEKYCVLVLCCMYFAKTSKMRKRTTQIRPRTKMENKKCQKNTHFTKTQFHNKQLFWSLGLFLHDMQNKIMRGPKNGLPK